MIEEIDMGEMKLPNLLILPCFWEEGGGMKRNERGMSGGNKKSPRCVTQRRALNSFVFLRHKAMATFVLWGMISPSLIFIFCLQLHVCGLPPRIMRHEA